MLLIGCSAEENIGNAQATQEDRMPLRLEATLSSDSYVTRAVNNTFAENDELLAYIRHTTGGTLGHYTLTPAENPGKADQASLLVRFTIGNDEMTVVNTNTGLTADTPLYWDDFSDSRTAATDLHTAGHGLQSYYGYCYNGGTPTTALDPDTGTLEWSVGAITADTVHQNTTAAIQQADLLWSAEQPTVEYAHATAREGVEHGTLSIPYTHAMSEITVELVAGEGFSTTTDPLGDCSLTLTQMHTIASLTAPSTTVTASGTPANIIMYGDNSYKDEETGAYKRRFTALVAPGTILKENTKLLDITNVDDNNYSLPITAAMLATGTGKWGSQLTEKTDDGTYYETLPGVNYHLTVTVNKTLLKVEATIADWKTVEATGTGAIDYPSIDFSLSGIPFENGDQFYLYQLLQDEDSDEKDERTNTAYGLPATIATYSTAGTGTWSYSPLIFWPNKTDKFYFRGLSKSTYDVTQGATDVLWGQSGDDDSYSAGAAIGPRKTEVPMLFYHVMSKVTLKLKTTDDATPTANNAKVDLTGATIAISNLHTDGIINIEDGSISFLDTNGDAEIDAADRTGTNAITGNGTTVTQGCLLSLQDYLVIPQTIHPDTRLTISLADGTTYTLQLNQCKDEGNKAISSWERGKSYTYVIHVEKEQTTFRALVKSWDEKEGSGEANLEWD